MSDTTVRKEKYARLELSMRTMRERFRDYNQLKRLVITADATATLECRPKYLNVAVKLNLVDAASQRELRDLYSEVLDPIMLELFKVRSRVIGQRLTFGFGANVAPVRKESEEGKDLIVREFADFLKRIFKGEDLKDRTYIKAVLLYPLTIAVINTWRKFDDAFAGKIIEAIKSNETEDDLKQIIGIIDIAVIPPRR